MIFTAGVLAQESDDASPEQGPEVTEEPEGTPDEASPVEEEPPVEGEAPAEDEATAAPAEQEASGESDAGEGSEDGEAEEPAEDEEPAEGEEPGEGEESAEGEEPVEADAPAGDSPEDASTTERPQPVEAPVMADPSAGVPDVESNTPEPEVAAAATEDGAAETEDDSGLERQGAEQVWSNAMPFRGTRLIYENVFNAYQLSRNEDLTYNPYYAMSLSIQPRWYFTDQLSLRMRFDVEGELTDADSTTDYHETRVSDLTVDLVYNPFVRIPGVGVDVGAGIRMQFPTSLQSQAETRYLGLGADLRLARVFDVLDGLLLAYTFRYMKYLNRYTTLERDTNPYGTFCSPSQPDCLAHHQIGDMAVSHRFYNTLLIGLDFLTEQWRRMSLAFMVVFINSLAYEAPEAEVAVNDQLSVPVDHINDPQNHRASIWYILELSVMITDYLTASVGTSTLTPQLAPDSTYREPIFNRYTNVYVDLSLDIERLVAAVRR